MKMPFSARSFQICLGFFLLFYLAGCGVSFQSAGPEDSPVGTVPVVTATGTPAADGSVTPTPSPTTTPINVPSIPPGAIALVPGQDAAIQLASGRVLAIRGEDIAEPGWLVVSEKSSPTYRPLNQNMVLAGAGFDFMGYVRLKEGATVSYSRAGATNNRLAITRAEGPIIRSLQPVAATQAPGDSVASVAGSMLPANGETTSVGEIIFNSTPVETRMIFSAEDLAALQASLASGRPLRVLCITNRLQGDGNDAHIERFRNFFNHPRRRGLYDMRPTAQFSSSARPTEVGQIWKAAFQSAGLPAAVPRGDVLDWLTVDAGAIPAFYAARGLGATRTGGMVLIDPPLGGTYLTADQANSRAARLASGGINFTGLEGTISDLAPDSSTITGLRDFTHDLDIPSTMLAGNAFRPGRPRTPAWDASVHLDQFGQHSGFVPLALSGRTGYTTNLAYKGETLDEDSDGLLAERHAVTIQKHLVRPIVVEPTTVVTANAPYQWEGMTVGPWSVYSAEDGNVFRFDITRGATATVKVSVAASGANFTGSCQRPSICDSGEFSAFTAVAPTGRRQAYLRRHRLTRSGDRAIDESWTRAVLEGTGDTTDVVIAPEGSWLVLTINSPEITGDAGGHRQIVAKARENSSQLLLSVFGGNPSAVDCDQVATNWDATTVAFARGGQIYLVKATPWLGRIDSSPTRASLTNNGAQADGPCSAPALDPDGRWLAFLTEAPNFGGAPGRSVVAVRDLTESRTYNASVDGNGRPLTSVSSAPTVGRDGDVAFATTSEVRVWNAVDRVSTLVEALPTGTSLRRPSIAPDRRSLWYAKGATPITTIAPNTAIPIQ